jgi:hypothetical protein
MVVDIKIAVFWDVTLCKFIDGWQYFIGTCCHHLRSSKMLVPVYQSSIDGITFQKTNDLVWLCHIVALRSKPSPVFFQAWVWVLVSPTLYCTFIIIWLCITLWFIVILRPQKGTCGLCIFPDLLHSFLQPASPYTPLIICPLCSQECW